MFREALHEQEPTDDDKVCSAMLDDWKITIGELSDELGLSFVSVQSIDRRFGHKTCLSEICPKTDDSRAERDLLPCADQYSDFMKTINYG
jgi:hypothetical protein